MLLALGIGHIGILRGLDGAFENGCLFLPVALLYCSASCLENATDIVFKGLQLGGDLVTLHSPCEVESATCPVGYIRSLDFGTFDQCGVELFRIIDLLIASHACRTAVGELVLICR